MDSGHRTGRDTPFTMAAIVSDIKLCQTVKRLFEIALFAAHPRQGEQDRSPLARLS